MKPLYYLLITLIASFSAMSLQAQTEEWKLLNKGNRAFMQKNYAEALKSYNAALKLNPQSSRARFNIGDCYIANGYVKGAIEQYDTVINLEHNNIYKAMAFHNKGFIHQMAAEGKKDSVHLQQHFLREAIKQYKSALRLNPRDEDTRYNLALCQKQLKNDDKGGAQNQQQQQQQQQEQQNQQQQQQQQQTPAKPKPDKADPQTQQYLNLSRQAERRALEKVKSQGARMKSLDKNW